MRDPGTKAPTRGYGLFEGFLARRRAAMADSLIPDGARDGCILDIGCGVTPYFLGSVDFARKHGIDKSAGSASDSGGINLYRHALDGSSGLPFNDGTFSVVTMLAFMEHVEPEILPWLLGETRRVLKPGGTLIITVPAGWTDGLLRLLARIGMVSRVEIDDHKDVYDRRKIADALDEAGFEEIETGSFKAFMNLWATARAPQARPH